MSKIHLINLLCLLSAVNVLTDDVVFDEKMSLEDMIGMFEGIGVSCEPAPTKEMIRELILHEENPRRESKCFARCVMEMFEMHLPDSNQLNEEKIIKFGKMMYPDKTDHIREMIQACNLKNAEIEDKCEATHAHSMCMYREAKEREFEIPEFE